MFNKVRSNSNLNHDDELKRLDNRIMNASQPLEDDWRKSKISSDISWDLRYIWIFLMRAESSSLGIWTDQAFKKLQNVLRCVNFFEMYF